MTYLFQSNGLSGYREPFLLEHFNMSALFHQIVQDSPVDFLLFLKTKEENTELEEICPFILTKQNAHFCLCLHNFHSSLNSKPHGMKVKEKIVC
jgi:hypothetical protein